MTIALGEDRDTAGGLSSLLFGRPLTFQVYGDAPIAVEAPITYQRAQYVLEAGGDWFLIPSIHELWHVTMWTPQIQAYLERRKLQAELAPKREYRERMVPCWKDGDRPFWLVF